MYKYAKCFPNFSCFDVNNLLIIVNRYSERTPFFNTIGYSPFNAMVCNIARK